VYALEDGFPEPTILAVENSIAKILVVEDEVNQRTALAKLLASWGYSVETARDGADALNKLKTFEADVVTTDLNMPVLDGRGLLEELRRLPEVALETIHSLGAFWYLEKPLQATALRMILTRALEKKRLADHASQLERELASRGVLGELAGESPAMQEIFQLLQQVAPTNATILLTGESGTGKEVAARTIHQLSPRRSGPFFAVNCAAMPESLMESELFGHEKGAFTGAVVGRAGCFELARNGTLLLDEIGDMPLGTQAKLLRVLEERRVRRLGSSKEVELDVRVLASTNMNLLDAIGKSKFREDLYFRLNVFEVHLPPLRERKQDISRLTAELLQGLNHRHNCKVTDLAPEVSTLFSAYDWPGNVRELRNVLERAVILAGAGTATVAHLPRGFAGTPKAPNSRDASGTGLEPGMTVAEGERALIELTLRHTGGNRVNAAEILGISAKTLFNKLREYGGDS
jgi:DNA-binding NtrC family response regulator